MPPRLVQRYFKDCFLTRQKSVCARVLSEVTVGGKVLIVQCSNPYQGNPFPRYRKKYSLFCLGALEPERPISIFGLCCLSTEAGREQRRNSPVKFPVCREMQAETSSRQTAPTVILFRNSHKVQLNTSIQPGYCKSQLVRSARTVRLVRLNTPICITTRQKHY